MFTNLQIPKKIALSFACILVTTLVMTVVILMANRNIASSADNVDRDNAVVQQATEMEMQLLRMNSQMRGFSITADEKYLEQYYDGQERSIAAAAELEKILPTATERDLASQSAALAQDWRANKADVLIERVRQGDAAGVQAYIRNAGDKIRLMEVLAPLRELKASAQERLVASQAAHAFALKVGLWSLIVGGAIMLAIAIAFSRLLSRQLARPIVDLTSVMESLAQGQNNVQVPHEGRGDELGTLAHGLVVFREAALAKARADAEQEEVVRKLATALEKVSDGDLSTELSNFPTGYAKLQSDFNEALLGLSNALGRVATNAREIDSTANEITTGSNDLSLRAERQAANLEETAAAIEEMSASFGETAANAGNAAALVETAMERATDGQDVAQRTNTAMAQIDRSSKEILDIISVIDGIAFQTNLLALNAGVEAARAGDAGKGFAVVAHEVRTLAQRSAEAATDVKRRILASAAQVEEGVSLVSESEESLQAIADSVHAITGLISTIAKSTREQADTMGQINIAISDIDSITQENAAFSEESNAAIQELANRTREMQADVERFRLRDDTTTDQWQAPHQNVTRFAA